MSEFSFFYIKMAQLMGERCERPPPITYNFSVSILSDLIKPLFLFLDQGGGVHHHTLDCLSLSKNRFIGNMVLV